MKPDKKTILILASNPKTTPRLRLDEEVREIKEGLRRAKYRSQFRMEPILAVRRRDFQRALLDYKPQIVHFTGHGKTEGLMVEDELGFSKLFSSKALAGLFKLCSNHVECVVLSTCYSAPQAAAISKHIDYVIGMEKEIEDKAAIEFAVGFYDALGAGHSIEEAFEFGRAAILGEFPDLPEHLVPVLKKRKVLKKQDGEKKVDKKEKNEKKTTALPKLIVKILKISIPLAFFITVFVFIDRYFIGLFNDKLLNIKMVYITTGNFLRGTSQSEIQELLNNHPDWTLEMVRDETPQREIYLDAFYISKYEITNKQYGKFLKDNPQHPKPGNWNLKNFNDSDQPVVGVSWDDAVAFCNWLSKKTAGKYKLPSEAQWEKAARGTNGGMFPWGDSGTNIQIANYNNPYGKPMPVGYYPRGENPVYGTMEMAGNVAEWCNDWYDERYYVNLENTKNPGGPLTGQKKVVRGGSWIDNAFFLRCTARNCYPPDTRREIIGFRIVRIPGN